MIEFGKTLRAAREAKGLVPGDIAQRTHMMIQTVEGLEKEDFSKIVAPIYGRGFVKLYCEVVGLEPKPMVDAFMELYNGTRSKSAPHEAPPPPPPPPPPPVQAKPVAPAAPEPPPAKPVAPAAPESPPKPAELDFGFTSSIPPPAPTPAPRTETTPPRPEQSLSRYAGNLPPELEPRFKLPSVNINWRLVALAAGAFVVLLVITLAIRAVYRATMTAPEDASEPIATQTLPDATEQAGEAVGEPTDADTTDAAPKTPRKPLPLKPFYIDSDHSTETERKQ